MSKEDNEEKEEVNQEEMTRKLTEVRREADEELQKNEHHKLEKKS